MRFILILLFAGGFALQSLAQNATLSGNVASEGIPTEWVNIGLFPIAIGTATDSAGNYHIQNIPPGKYTLKASSIMFAEFVKTIEFKPGENKILNIELLSSATALDEVVVTGTLKEVNRMESAVPVEVYNAVFFRKNPSPNIFEGLQNINGVRPQINCNVCNTGDIHINGLEGPYTMVLIDGMPIVSSLATVYGLSGIPNSLVERIEVVKGPASSLYGSEAVGGLINVITKSTATAPVFSMDVFGTSWLELNADIGFKYKLGSKASCLTGMNVFNYGHPTDNNNDNFTDVTLQKRISVFQKINFNRKENRLMSIAGRFFYENRWGGEMQWTEDFRGGDSIYGESIYTRRWELIGTYQLPIKEKMLFSFSYNDHDQNSVYGTTKYLAQQRIGFTQLIWDKKAGAHDMLAGATLRFTHYDDNTTATASGTDNKPDNTWLPGVFVQDEITLAPKHKLLLGVRYDYNSRHGNIFTPRLAYKWSIKTNDILRLNAGTGFRVVNLFTEEHAALTGARNVKIKEDLKPEQSLNVNLNYLKKIYASKGYFISIETSAWFTYFNNRILPNYEEDVTAIIYTNLEGHAVSTGLSANLDVSLPMGLKFSTGATYMEVYTVEDDAKGNSVKSRQLLTEKFTGTWGITYKIKPIDLSIDYTGNVYGKMLLPLLGPLDPRAPESPIWSIQNIQFTYSGVKNLELYAGAKNLLNWTPNKNTPFIIARANDPFDKNVQFDGTGQPIATPDNPQALTFDPTYSYGPNQGIRAFFGIRYRWDK